MKLLGHAWVAVNSIEEGNLDQIVVGSVLPEMMYYTKSNPFIKSEIHEGGDIFYQFLKIKHFEFKDIGLGMVAHSVKYGADRFNFDDKMSVLGFLEESALELRKRLVEILHVDFETSKTRLHNILELAVEANIVRDHPEFIKDFCSAISNKDLENSSAEFLSECFNKDKDKVEESVVEIFGKAKPEYFQDSDGLARLWMKLSCDFDPEPDLKSLSNLLSDLSNNFNGKDRLFLKECIDWTRGNIQNLI